MKFESPTCTNSLCLSSSTVRVVPDRVTASPWQCQDCGQIFGTAETDSGLLKQHQRPPSSATVVSLSDEVCCRCGRTIGDEETDRIVTNTGPVCGDCLTLEEFREI